MNKRRLSIVGLGLLVVVAIVSMTGCAGFFDRVADTVLANEVRYDDREAPRTAYPIAASADAVQLAGGQGKGLSCSLPPFAQALAFNNADGQAPIALQMRQACAFHDYCYRHGNATYGYSQADCDFMLQQQAFRLCKFINTKASISDCETDARKVTLGVRLGGWGSFMSARTPRADKASTFMEFDPYPVKATSYRVVRIADAPRSWVSDGLLPRAAYHFDIKPSGSLVHILGWKASGAMVCTSFTLPATYNALNGAPLVVRDGAGGEDWFVWWRRYELAATHGYFSVLPAGRALEQDWAKAAGGFAQHHPGRACEYKAAWDTKTAAGAAPVLAFVTGNSDQNLSEVHPVNGLGMSGADTPGIVRLMGLSTHSCGTADKDVSPCIVNIEFDTVRKQFLAATGSPRQYSIFERNCGGRQDGKPRDDCDRYRNYVSAPVVVPRDGGAALLWTRRGAGNGDGYESVASVRRYAIGKQPGDVATDLGELNLTGFPEAMEPAFVLSSAAASPSFVSLVAAKDRTRMLLRTATPAGKESPPTELECRLGDGTAWRADASWLRRPAAHVQVRQDDGRSYIVFTRVTLTEQDDKVDLSGATLEIAVATLRDGACSAVHEQAFAVFDGFAAREERAAAALVASQPTSANIGAARDVFGRFAQRVRGGQMVLADLTGDTVPELVQIAKLPGKDQHFRAIVLTGSIDPAGLRFTEMAGPGLESLFTP